MGKYGLYIVLFITIIFTGIVSYMKYTQPNVGKQILNIAEKSYFLGCAESLINLGMPKNDVIINCKAEAFNYKNEMARVIGEEFK